MRTLGIWKSAQKQQRLILWETKNDKSESVLEELLIK